MSYLDMAAAELAKAHADNEKRGAIAAENERAGLPFADILAEVNARRLEIADGFIRLAELGAVPAVTGDDRELIARAREVGLALRASNDDRTRLAGWLLKELADRLDGQPAGSEPPPV